MPKSSLKKELGSLDFKFNSPYRKVSLIYPKGVWCFHVLQFQYDITIDGKHTLKEARKLALKEALDYYNQSDYAKGEYLKWLLKIQ